MNLKPCPKCCLPMDWIKVKEKYRIRERWRCAPCHRALQRACVAKKPEQYKKNGRQDRQRRRNFNMQLAVNYLRQHPCVDCGETDWVILQFDHVRGKKLFTISSALMHRKWEAIAKEIEKCEIRCANCHIRRTIKSNGWLKYVS